MSPEAKAQPASAFSHVTACLSNNDVITAPTSVEPVELAANERRCQQGHVFDIATQRLPYRCHCGAPAQPASLWRGATRNRRSLTAALSDLSIVRK